MTGIPDGKGKILKDATSLFAELSKRFPSNNYTQFCNEFGVDFQQANSILKDQNLGNQEKALKQVLNEWLSSGKDVNRAKLESALQNADTGGLKSIVKKHFKKDAVVDEEESSDENQLRPQTSNSINAAGSSYVLGNTMIGKTNVCNQSTPTPPAVQNRNPGTSDSKRPATAPQGSAPKRQQTDQPGPSTLKQTVDKPKNVPIQRKHDRCVKPADPASNPDPDMHYTMWESPSKGKALIIANEDFKGLARRPWAKMDRDNMKELLGDLGYNFQNKQYEEDVYENLTAKGMEDTIRQFTRELDETPKPQSAMVYISSHGNEQGINGTLDEILSIITVLKLFSGVLLGKPKVIIIDACWGGEETQQVSVPNSGPGSQPSFPLVPENSDTFVLHSTSLGKLTWSYDDKGSWLVDKLTKVVYDKTRHLEDLDTIMLRVTKDISQITAKDRTGKNHGTQSTTVIKQGVTRKLFFYPGFSTTNA